MKKSSLKRIPLEAYLWTVGLAALAFVDSSSSHHFTICPLYLMGFDHCPGCGLGRSINLLLFGNVQASIQTHPLGIVALSVISFRIYTLIKTTYYGQNY